MLAKHAVLLASLALTAAAPPPGRPIVLELFTSQGCSSCPPADALLTTYAKTRPELLPLAFHVEYWNNLGWRDPFSSAAATARQRQQAGRLGETTIYTPELVVDGGAAVIGSDQADAERAIRSAQTNGATLATVRMRRESGGELSISVGPGVGRANLVLVGFDRAHTTPIGRGENGGRTLMESNIVRSFQPIGQWTGAALDLRHPAPDGETAAVILETAEGRVVGAARLE